MRTVIFIVFLFTINISFAQDVINIDKELKARLSAKLHSDQYCKTVIENLSYSIEKSDVHVIKDSIARIPNGYEERFFKNTNCSNEERGFTQVFSLSVTETKSLTYTSSISSSLNLNLSLSYTGIGAGASVQESISLSNSQSQSTSSTTTLSQNIDLKVKPKSILYIRLSSIKNKIYVPFEGSITINGSFDAKTTQTMIGAIKLDCNGINKHTISDLLDAVNRTFFVKGFIENTNASALDVFYNEKPTNDSICSSSNITIQNKKIIANPDNINDSAIEISKNEVKDSIFNETIEEYFNSTTINVCDCYSNVEVRHMSMGPGTCAVVTQSSKGSQVGVTALPAVWTGWQIIESLIGETTITLTDEVICDTGIRSQVKYFKKK